MSKISILDLDVRLFLVKESYVNIIDDYINSLKFGKQNVKNIRNKLILIDVYITLLNNYNFSNNDSNLINCISEDKLKLVFDKLSSLTGICFQPIGYKYIGSENYINSSEEIEDDV
jgi:hypothetical protein